MPQQTDVHTPSKETARVTAPELESILYQPLPVLDHGFVRVVDYMGNDDSIVQAARVSYGKGTKKRSEDRGLIRYLMRHRHSTPFEMCEIKLHIKLPIFIARQWVRHRTANINEYSARYSILDREFYIPSLPHMAAQSTSNHQGRGDTFPPEKAQQMQDMLKKDALRCYETYETLLGTPDGEPGLARELARINLNLNYYTQWYWKIDLHNLMHFLSLRADSHAQYEIQAYADVILDIMALWVPLAYEAFCDYRKNGAHLSQKALNIVQRMLKGESIPQADSGLSQREWDELATTLDMTPHT